MGKCVARGCSGIACLTLYGDKFPVDDAAFLERELAFKVASRYCLLAKELAEIMNFDERTRRQYLKGLVQAQSKVFFYDISGDARNTFQ